MAEHFKCICKSTQKECTHSTYLALAYETCLIQLKTHGLKAVIGLDVDTSTMAIPTFNSASLAQMAGNKISAMTVRCLGVEMGHTMRNG